MDDRYRWSKQPELNDLIPLETKRGASTPPGGKWQKRLIVGHNVGFDRSFVKEQYFIQVNTLKKKNLLSTYSSSLLPFLY